MPLPWQPEDAVQWAVLARLLRAGAPHAPEHGVREAAAVRV